MADKEQLTQQAQQLQLADFMDLFEGNRHNYGQHTYDFTASGKEEGKNLTVKNTLLTSERYKAHLNGKMGLGIIPITDSGQCKFAVIDVDVYDANLDVYLKAIENNDFPLVPFKSKSGGLHLYLFLKQYASAGAMVDVMNIFSIMLGIDIYIKDRLNKVVEIFPKQTKLGKGAIGSWINIPYYDAKNARQCALKGGKELNFSDGLAFAKEQRKTLQEVRGFISSIPYSDGPPCLQTINVLDVMDKNSGRNNYLFAFGVYFKKRDPEFWEQRLYEINRGIKDPLTSDELESTIISSLRKKEYTYKCLEVPCVNYCRRSVCKTRDFGVGKEGGYFSELEYGTLHQIRTSEPYYEWEVKTQGADVFELLRFKSEEDIIKQDAFLRLCFRYLHVLPVKLKQSEWFKIINQALSNIEIKGVSKEEDTSPLSLFKSIFIEFLLNRAPALTRDQIFNKRVFHDEDEDGYYFRANDLSEYIFMLKGFRYFTPGELHGILKDIKAKPTRIRTESGKQLRVYQISKSAVEDITMIDDILTEVEFDKGEKEEF